MSNEIEYAYSRDGETYYSDYDDVMSDIESDYEPGEEFTIYRGKTRRFSHDDFMLIEYFLEGMQEQAYEEADIHAEGYLDKLRNDKEKCKELALHIKEWLDENTDEITFFTVDDPESIDIIVGENNE